MEQIKTALGRFLVPFFESLLFSMDLMETTIFWIGLKLKMIDGQKALAAQTVAEEDSAWQVLEALKRQGPSLGPAEKAEMLRHIFEEREHAAFLGTFLNAKGRKLAAKSMLSRDAAALDRGGEYFVKVGEKAAIRRYKMLLFFKTMPSLEKAYLHILKDEAKHEKAGKDEREDQLEYAKALAKYCESILSQKLGKLGAAVATVILAPFYYLIFFPLAKLSLLLEGDELEGDKK